MKIKQVPSPYKKVNLFDFIKGALLSGIMVLVTFALQTFEHWVDNPDMLGKVEWADIYLSLKLAFATFLSYLVKNFFQNSDSKPFIREN